MSETTKRLQLATIAFGSYALWLSLTQTIGLALVTYGMIDSKPGIQEIADQYSLNFWTIQGLGSFSYFLLCWGLSISRPLPWPELNISLWRMDLFPTLIRAVIAAVLFVMLLMLLSPFESLGPGLSWSVAPWGVLNWATRSLAWFGWALGDELVFRKFLLDHLRIGFQKSTGPKILRRFSEEFALGSSTVLWILTRSWHEPLGWTQTSTLFLLGLILGSQVLRGRHYLVGAAWLAGSSWTFQCLFSLPLLGHDHTGLWLIRFSSPETGSFSGFRLIHGGAGGPGASLLLQFILFVLLLKILWTRRRGSIR